MSRSPIHTKITPHNDAKGKGVDKSPVVKKTPCRKGYLEGNSKSKLDNCQKIVEKLDLITNILNADRNSIDEHKKRNVDVTKGKINNNMEDKETCKCNRRVTNDQNAVECDLCEYWFHL